jgi:hypothetical protein
MPKIENVRKVSLRFYLTGNMVVFALEIND